MSRRIIALVGQGLRFVRDHDFATVLAAINSKDAHPTVQFAKYSVCGTAATAVQVGAFYLFVHTLFPAALDRGVADDIRRNNAVYANLAAFPISNTFAYLTNVFWVFTGGRHDRLKEFFLFTFVSGLSFGSGLVAGPQLIQWFGISTHLAQASFVVASALVNFLARKFLVFKR
jgi:putative flippase GtrA